MAQNVLAYVPVPTLGSQVIPQQNAANNTGNYQGLGRLDFNGLQHHSIEGMYFNSQGTQVSPTQRAATRSSPTPA